MKKYFVIYPEVPGGLGPRSILDRSVHPPIIEKLHYIFDGWLGDQIVTFLSNFLITQDLALEFKKRSISGFELREFEMEISDQFREVFGDKELPAFKWLVIHGIQGTDDLFKTEKRKLAVSEAALELILEKNLKPLQYVEFER